MQNQRRRAFFLNPNPSTNWWTKGGRGGGGLFADLLRNFLLDFIKRAVRTTQLLSLAEMEKTGDAGDAVSANFFQLCNFFGFSTKKNAKLCVFLHNFVVFLPIYCIFLLIFARICVFLHMFFVLIFQAQKLCQCYFSHFFQLWR